MSDTTPNISFLQVIKFASHYWRRNTPLLGATIFFMILCCVAQNGFVPLFVRHITDLIAMGDHTSIIVQKDLWYSFSVIAVLSILQGIFWSVSIVFWNVHTVRTYISVGADALYKVQRFSSDWHANAFAGGTVRKINRGNSAFETFSDRIFLGFFVVFLVMGIMISMLSTRLPYVAGYVFVMTFLYFFISVYFSRKILIPMFRESAAADTKIGGTLADIITGIPTIKSFAGENREDEIYSLVNKDWGHKTIRAWQWARGIDTIRTILRVLMFLGMLGIVIWQWTRGTATTGDVALVLTSFFMVQNMLRDMGVNINDVQRAYADMVDIVHFWSRDDDVVDRLGAHALAIPANGGVVSFQHVMFAYKNTRAPVYQGLSIDIAPGERVALVGPSGSGKSTFVKLLQRLYDIQGGAILIDGQNIADVTQQSLRSHIALVPQDPVLFHRSLSENIAYGRPDATQDEIEDAARQAFAHDFIVNFPQGYDTLVGERGVKLSGGERQRVAIARAILTRAPILVMDEATSSLDSISEHYIQQALENLMRGRTVITIAHRLATIRAVDRILVFDKGHIIEQGSHAALINNPASVYKRLYDMQALGLVA